MKTPAPSSLAHCTWLRPKGRLFFLAQAAFFCLSSSQQQLFPWATSTASSSPFFFLSSRQAWREETSFRFLLLLVGTRSCFSRKTGHNPFFRILDQQAQAHKAPWSQNKKNKGKKKKKKKATEASVFYAIGGERL